MVGIMPIAFLPPLPPEDGWISHRREVKCCRGSACYAALAAHFGTDSPKTLELRVDGRKPYDVDGEVSISNKYRRWRQGSPLPGDATVSKVLKRSGGSVRLGFWRDLPLWELLAPEPPSMQRIHQLLETTSPMIKRVLFMDRMPNRQGRYQHSPVERDQVLVIRNQGTLDALIALLCLARKGEVLEDDPRQYLPAAGAFDVLPRVLYAHKPLRYRWEDLFACLERIFWKRVYSIGATYSFPMEQVQSGLETLTANPAAKLPFTLGARNRAPAGIPSPSSGARSTRRGR